VGFHISEILRGKPRIAAELGRCAEAREHGNHELSSPAAGESPARAGLLGAAFVVFLAIGVAKKAAVPSCFCSK